MAKIKNLLGQSVPVPLLRNGKVVIVTLPKRGTLPVNNDELTSAARNLDRLRRIKILD